MTSIVTYEQMKNFYAEFKNNPPKDDFIRWYREHNFAKSLKEYAQKQNLKEDIFQYEQIEKQAANKLKSLGYKI